MDVLSLLLLAGLACALRESLRPRRIRYDVLAAGGGSVGASLELGSASQAADPAQLLDNQRRIIAQLADLTAELHHHRAVVVRTLHEAAAVAPVPDSRPAQAEAVSVY